MQGFPERINNDAELWSVLTAPSEQLVEAICKLSSPLVILGAGGKMGPSLAALAKRAAELAGHPLEIVAASRFRDNTSRSVFENEGVATRATDVFDRQQVAELPDSPNVIYLVGMKFGTATDPVPTWITNTLGPIVSAERYAGSRVVALSTGNVYPLASVTGPGSNECDPLTPLGEYANAAVARERIFEHYARQFATPTTLVRLNYAHDLRYGVVTDLARKIVGSQAIDLSMGFFNAIWQGDANESILRCFELCSSPATAINLTSPQIYRVREIASQLAKRLDKTPEFVGEEQSTALLSDARKLVDVFGPPRLEMPQMLDWIAHWETIGGTSLGKPTHFESRDGKY